MQFLRAQFPMLEQAVLFFTDFLEQDAAGYYVTNPSVSPENTYILPDGVRGHLCIGPTMDRQILRETAFAAATFFAADQNNHMAPPRMDSKTMNLDGLSIDKEYCFCG